MGLLDEHRHDDDHSERNPEHNLNGSLGEAQYLESVDEHFDSFVVVDALSLHTPLRGVKLTCPPNVLYRLEHGT